MSIKDEKKTWVKNIQRGDEKYFELLFKKYYMQLSRFAWRYVKSKAVAEDLVQGVFADIWEKRTEWEPQRSLHSYLYKSVKNRALDYLRHQEVQKTNDPDWVKDNKEKVRSPSDEIDQRDHTQKVLTREIENLPTRSKMCFKLHRYDGLTYKEIAEVMDISIKTVESQMTRTMKRLRTRLTPILHIGFIIVLQFILL